MGTGFLCASPDLMWKHHGGLEELEGGGDGGEGESGLGLGWGGNVYLISPYTEPRSGSWQS